MDFALNEEQRSLVALMKDFCEREIDRRQMSEIADQPIPFNATKKELMARIPWDIISKAHDAGLRQLAVPTEYGGGGYCHTGGWVTLTAMAEAAGYYGGQFARLFTLPWNHCVRFYSAPKRIQDIFFTNFMSNRRTLTAASHSEPNAGSDVFMPYESPDVGKVVAVQDGDYWVINGDKMFCTAGGQSDLITVTVRTDPGANTTKAFSQFLIDTRNTPGWSIARVNDFMGNEVPVNVQMRFDNVRVHKDMMISEPNGAYTRLKSGVASKTIHFTAHLGECQRAFEEMRDYAKARIQGGKPIIEHPNVGQLIAEADLMLRADRLVHYKFAWDCDQEEGDLVDPLGFYYVNYMHKKTVLRIIEIGMEVYGGLAPTKELGFERFVRQFLTIYHGGSTGILSLVKASRVL